MVIEFDLGVYVFPTGVGMNRQRGQRNADPPRVPHGRGDEPNFSECVGVVETVFPTGVGMNRLHGRRALPDHRVPHGRGDEPDLSDPLGINPLCSPRAWG